MKREGKKGKLMWFTNQETLKLKFGTKVSTLAKMWLQREELRVFEQVF